MTSEATPTKHGSASDTAQQGDDKGSEAENLADKEDEEPAPSAAAAAAAGKAAKCKSKALKARRGRGPVITLTEEQELELFDFLKGEPAFYNKGKKGWAHQKELDYKWQPFCEKYGYTYEELRRW